VDLEDFRYGGTNITAFRLVDPNNPLVMEVVRYLQLWQDLLPLVLEDFRYGRTNIATFNEIFTNFSMDLKSAPNSAFFYSHPHTAFL
jgi:hypothetical protein